jgi:hypothetical protein
MLLTLRKFGGMPSYSIYPYFGLASAVMLKVSSKRTPPLREYFLDPASADILLRQFRMWIGI